MLLTATRSYLDGTAASWPSSMPQPCMPGETINPSNQIGKDKNAELHFICKTKDTQQPTCPHYLPGLHVKLKWIWQLQKWRRNPLVFRVRQIKDLKVLPTEQLLVSWRAHVWTALPSAGSLALIPRSVVKLLLLRLHSMGWETPPFYRG